jgi:hypothetical protein
MEMGKPILVQHARGCRVYRSPHGTTTAIDGGTAMTVVSLKLTLSQIPVLTWISHVLMEQVYPLKFLLRTTDTN